MKEVDKAIKAISEHIVERKESEHEIDVELVNALANLLTARALEKNDNLRISQSGVKRITEVIAQKANYDKAPKVQL